MTPEHAQGMLDYYDKMGGFDLTWEEIAAVLKQVANLRYEYAVQVPVATVVPGEPVWRFFIRRGTNGGAILTSSSGLAKWDTSQRDAKKRAELHELTGHRIIRRLVGEPEVVE